MVAVAGDKEVIKEFAAEERCARAGPLVRASSHSRGRAVRSRSATPPWTRCLRKPRCPARPPARCSCPHHRCAERQGAEAQGCSSAGTRSGAARGEARRQARAQARSKARRGGGCGGGAGREASGRAGTAPPTARVPQEAVTYTGRSEVSKLAFNCGIFAKTRAALGSSRPPPVLAGGARRLGRGDRAPALAIGARRRLVGP